jgi:hypothetical protein
MANYVSKYTGAEIEAILEASSTKLNSNQTANYVLAAPNGSAGKPTFRKLVAADIPSLAASKITSGTFDAARIPSLNASKITAGTLSADRIPTLGVAKISGLATVATSGKYSDLSGVPGKATTQSDGLMSKEDKSAIADISRATDSEGNVFITAIPYLNVTNTLSIKGTNISSLFAAKSVESNFYEFTEYAENTYAVKTVENLLLEDVGDDMILISQAGENPVWMNPGDIFDFVPISHATSSTTYGLGTTSKYGHVKISNGDVNTVASANGLVAGMDHSHGNYALTTKLPKFSLSGTVLTITDNS